MNIVKFFHRQHNHRRKSCLTAARGRHLSPLTNGFLVAEVLEVRACPDEAVVM